MSGVIQDLRTGFKGYWAALQIKIKLKLERITIYLCRLGGNPQDALESFTGELGRVQSS